MFKKLKPSKEGLKVLNPATSLHLPEDGKEVEINSYWRRRLEAGEVVEVTAKKVSMPSQKIEKKQESKAKKMEGEK